MAAAVFFSVHNFVFPCCYPAVYFVTSDVENSFGIIFWIMLKQGYFGGHSFCLFENNFEMPCTLWLSCLSIKRVH